MSLYEIWYMDGHIMMEIEADSNKEARRKFQSYISVKKSCVNDKEVTQK